jgi:hypothetical protein
MVILPLPLFPARFMLIASEYVPADTCTMSPAEASE